jgi:hypothetical protein
MWDVVHSQAQGILFVMSALLTLRGINKTSYFQLKFKLIYLWLEPTGVEPLLGLFSNSRVLV